MIANGQRVVLNDTFAVTQMTHYLNREIKKTNTSALIIKKTGFQGLPEAYSIA